MKKEIKNETKKFTKQDKEKIENRLLTIFTIALGSVMILLYLINWFQGSIGFQRTAEVTTYVFFALFIFLIVLFKIKSNKAKKENLLEKASKFNNWFIFSIVGAVVTFFVYPSRLLKLVKLKFVDDKIINGLHLFKLQPLASRLMVIIIAIALYTVIMFIYWGVYMHKAHKASLNKGKNNK